MMNHIRLFEEMNQDNEEMAREFDRNILEYFFDITDSGIIVLNIEKSRKDCDRNDDLSRTLFFTRKGYNLLIEDVISITNNLNRINHMGEFEVKEIEIFYEDLYGDEVKPPTFRHKEVKFKLPLSPSDEIILTKIWRLIFGASSDVHHDYNLHDEWMPLVEFSCKISKV